MMLKGGLANKDDFLPELSNQVQHLGDTTS